MLRWIPYTFVRTVFFFIGGILAAIYFPDLLTPVAACAVVVALAIAYFLLVFRRKRNRLAPNPGALALLLVAVAGYAHVHFETESNRPEHLVNVEEEISHYKVVITRFAEERARTWKTEGSLVAARGDEWMRVSGRVMLYFSKADFPEGFRYGDVLLVRGGPAPPAPPGNPGEFDYRAYLALKNIYHQHFIRAGDVQRLGYDPPDRLMALAFRAREWAAGTLARFVEGERQQAIASALVLGVTDGLDNELLAAYAATGSMHILAVSGLHISILYFILLWILRPLNRFRGGRWVVAFLALALLWLYALVTGLSPSVLRAVSMFSFLAIARPWARSTNIYNTLAVSAFVLLLFDPFLIRSVGFQLSYLAVLGIVYLYPRIVVLWEPRHRVMTEVWKITAVSLAAQAATFPLGLFYFHQFPNYFLVSNLLVVPLSSVVLIAGLVVLGVAFMPPVAAGAGFCLEWIIALLNGIVFTLDGLPFGLTDNVYITAWQCALIVLLTAFILALLEFRQFACLVAAFTTVTAYAALQWRHFATDVAVRKLTVYRIPGHRAVDLIYKGRIYFLADAGLHAAPEKIRYHIAPNRLEARASVVQEEMSTTASLPGAELVVWGGKTILVATGAEFVLPRNVAVDWLIIGNNAVDIERLSTKISCEKLILDSSNSFFYATRFLEAAKLYKLEVHSVLHDGAFMTKIENQDT